MPAENALIRAVPGIAHWRAYLELCKPKVVALIVFTAMVGMLLAVPGAVPRCRSRQRSGSRSRRRPPPRSTIVVDREADARMKRTDRRPLPSGVLDTGRSVAFAAVLAALGMFVLAAGVNLLTAVLTFASMVGYAVIYTLYLKRATPQNIVIGGAAGAMPPVLGWAAVTGEVHPHALLLFLIVFVWTPPHFWALALHKRDEYARVDIPMLPVTHGEALTRLHILLYTVLLLVVTLLPYLAGMSGLVYLAAALGFGGRFLQHTWRLWRRAPQGQAMRTFVFSITYLMGLFGALLVDHYVNVLGASLSQGPAAGA
ncbi:MAG: heme o synthase [Halofilum sp. (in: g-proteobacteria)]|nr:heme o synthase [Halofilum sp. (in: g-proteobacteria)]